MSISDQIKGGTIADPATPLGALLYGVLFFFIAWLVGRALRSAIQRLANDSRMDRTALKFLAQLAQFAVYLFAFISYAHLVPALAGLGTAWLTSVSVISVIVGLAAQNTLGNLVAGISLLLYRPFKIGDRLQVIAPTGLETGAVESLDLGYTVLRTDDKRRITIPNSIMASQTTVNLSAEGSRVICSVPVSISYDSDIDKARSILLELAARHPKALNVCSCPVTQLGDSSVVLTLEVWCADGPAAGELKCDLLEQIKKRFALAGIKIPLFLYPTPFKQ